jgi:hypothetical protein
VRGGLVLPPHYFDVDWYLGTIATLRDLDPQHILATHYPPLVGQQAAAHIDASVAFVDRCDSIILDVLEAHAQPMEFLGIVEGVRRRLDICVSDIVASNYVFSLLVQAHLRRLVTAGRARHSEPYVSDKPYRMYSFCS